MRALIREAIEEVAARGNVVVVAHAASFALAGREDTLRVLVTASPETRAGRYEGSIKDSDAARADYLRRFYGVEHELPTHYDLVLNTDVVSVEKAAELIALAAALEHFGAPGQDVGAEHRVRARTRLRASAPPRVRLARAARR